MDVLNVPPVNPQFLLSENKIRKTNIPGRLNLSDDKLPPHSFDLYGTVNEYLNLSHRKLNNLFSIINTADKEDLNTLFSMIQKLIKHGIVGYEYLNINNRPYKSFISTSLLQPYSKAKIYRKPDFDAKTKYL